jgi:hypothetical protein
MLKEIGGWIMIIGKIIIGFIYIATVGVVASMIYELVHGGKYGRKNTYYK